MIDKAKKAAANYLKKKGYKIINRNFKTPAGVIDFVVKDTDENVLVFCQASVSNGEFSKQDVTRDQFEAMSICYMAKNSDEINDCAVRFDLIDIAVINKGRALLRHYINVFGEGSK